MAKPRRTLTLAWRDVTPFSCFVGERKLMTHFVVKCLFLRSLRLCRATAFVVNFLALLAALFPLTPSCCFVTVPLLCQLGVQGSQLWKTKLLSMI